MGAICWQVVHQNSKNSTSCKPPEARLTVIGSVASRLGPRDVAMGSAVGAASSGAAVACVTASTVEAGAGMVAVGTIMLGCTGDRVGVAGAHAVNKTASRPRRRKLALTTEGRVEGS